MAGSTIFSGSSRFSNDFGQIITRAVALASLPVSQLTNQKNALDAKSAALKSMQAQFTGLEKSLTNAGSAAGQKALVATVSDPAVLKTRLGAGALPGNYSVEVISAGSKTQTLSKNGLPVVSDPYATSVSTSPSLTLTVNGVDTVLTPATNTLADLAKAINASAAGVSANIINIGGNSSPDYRISLQSNKLGPISISLSDDTQDILDTLASGSLASYKVNGMPAAAIESDSRTVVVGLGLSIDLVRAGSAEISVDKSAETLTDSINSLVTAFNSATTELDKHRGTAGGALNGDSMLYTIYQQVRALTTYQAGSGELTRLDDIGLSIDRFGKMQLDAEKLQAVSTNNPQAVFQFLGTGTTDGFLKSALDSLKQLQDPNTGVFPSALTKLTKDISRQNDLIAENQKRVELMRDTLTQKMAMADAMIASLEQQINLFNGIFEAQSNARR